MSNQERNDLTSEEYTESLHCYVVASDVFGNIVNRAVGPESDRLGRAIYNNVGLARTVADAVMAVKKLRDDSILSTANQQLTAVQKFDQKMGWLFCDLTIDLLGEYADYKQKYEDRHKNDRHKNG